MSICRTIFVTPKPETLEWGGDMNSDAVQTPWSHTALENSQGGDRVSRWADDIRDVIGDRHSSD
jgi:hypothetical protein